MTLRTAMRFGDFSKNISKPLDRKVNVFGTVVTGETFAQTLSLGTTNFHIDQVEDGYRIISIGKGSSLGMSMYGAGWKADQGSTYREIITYYYPETSIVDGAAY